MPAPNPRRVLPRSRRWPGIGRSTLDEAEFVAVYGVTAVRYGSDGIESLMLGLLDPGTNTWAIPPAPARLIDVVDRLLGGDQVKIILPGPDSRLLSGAQLCVKMLQSGAETLEQVDTAAPGRSLQDLPRF